MTQRHEWQLIPVTRCLLLETSLSQLKVVKGTFTVSFSCYLLENDLESVSEERCDLSETLFCGGDCSRIFSTFRVFLSRSCRQSDSTTISVVQWQSSSNLRCQTFLELISWGSLKTIVDVISVVLVTNIEKLFQLLSERSWKKGEKYAEKPEKKHLVKIRNNIKNKVVGLDLSICHTDLHILPRHCVTSLTLDRFILELIVQRHTHKWNEFVCLCAEHANPQRVRRHLLHQERQEIHRSGPGEVHDHRLRGGHRGIVQVRTDQRANTHNTHTSVACLCSTPTKERHEQDKPRSSEHTHSGLQHSVVSSGVMLLWRLCSPRQQGEAGGGRRRMQRQHAVVSCIVTEQLSAVEGQEPAW